MASVTLRWRDRSNNELGFYLERCTGSVCSNFVAIATLAPNTTSYTDTGLSAGISYRYRIRAYNSRGYSSYSNIITVTTLPVPTPEPVPPPPPPLPPDPEPVPPPPTDTSQNRYVSLAGNDTNPGTINFPWQTLRYAYQQLVPGNALYIRGGLWAGVYNIFNDNYAAIPTGTIGNPITILGYPGETVVIQVPDTLAGLLMTSGQKYLSFRDFIIDGVNQVTPVDGQLAYFAGGVESCDFIRLTVKNGNNFGIQTSGNGGDATFLRFLECDVFDNGSMSEPNTNGHGYYIGTPDNTIYKGNVYRNKGMGIQINAASGSTQCSRNKLDSIRAYDNGQRPTTSASNYVVCRGTDILMINLLSYQTDLRTNLVGYQIYADTINAMLFNSTVYGHPYEGIFLQYYAGAPQIKNCISFGNGGDYHDYGGTGTPDLSNNLIGVNPSFVDAANGNFHLIPGSVAINTGITLTQVPYDFDNVPRPVGPAYSIGAFER